MPQQITNEEYLRGHRPQVLLPFEAAIVEQDVFTVHNVTARCEKEKVDHLKKFSTVGYPDPAETRVSLGSIVEYEAKQTKRRILIIGAQALHGTEIIDPRDASKTLHTITPDMPIGGVLIGKEAGDVPMLPQLGKIAIQKVDQSYRPSQATETTLADIEDPEQTDPHLVAA